MRRGTECVLGGMQISGKFNVDGSGNVDFKEEDGIDYAPVTVQMPGGERVPFLFTIKELQAKVRNGTHRDSMLVVPASTNGLGVYRRIMLQLVAWQDRCGCAIDAPCAAGISWRLWRRLCRALLPWLFILGPQGMLLEVQGTVSS